MILFWFFVCFFKSWKIWCSYHEFYFTRDKKDLTNCHPRCLLNVKWACCRCSGLSNIDFFSTKFWTRFFPHLFKPKTHPRVPFEADNNDQYREERRPRRCLNSLPSEEEGKAKKESFLASGLLCQNYQKGPSLAKKQKKKKKTTTYSQFRRIIYCSCAFISCNSRRKSRNWVKIKTNFRKVPFKEWTKKKPTEDSPSSVSSSSYTYTRAKPYWSSVASSLGSVENYSPNIKAFCSLGPIKNTKGGSSPSSSAPIF